MSTRSIGHNHWKKGQFKLETLDKREKGVIVVRDLKVKSVMRCWLISNHSNP